MPAGRRLITGDRGSVGCERVRLVVSRSRTDRDTGPSASVRIGTGAGRSRGGRCRGHPRAGRRRMVADAFRAAAPPSASPLALSMYVWSHAGLGRIAAACDAHAPRSAPDASPSSSAGLACAASPSGADPAGRGSRRHTIGSRRMRRHCARSLRRQADTIGSAGGYARIHRASVGTLLASCGARPGRGRVGAVASTSRGSHAGSAPGRRSADQAVFDTAARGRIV
jgi:hypothetical protein